MIVWRLEDKNGWGVWSGDMWNDRLCDFLDYEDQGRYHRGRSVYSSELRKKNEPRYPEISHRYGCDSKKRLQAYFGASFDKLINEHGAVVAKYKVRKNHVVFGEDNIELIFRMDKAEKITA